MRAALASFALVAAPALALAATPPRVVEDDWPRAAAEARERRVPVFVEAWAPW